MSKMVEKAIVHATWSPQVHEKEDGDLAGVVEGATIIVTKSEGVWWKGYIEGREDKGAGTFPAAFVLPFIPPESSVAAEPFGTGPEVGRRATRSFASLRGGVCGGGGGRQPL